MNYQNRLKSFAWRLGMMTIAFVCAYVAENIGALELSPQVTVVVGLVLGEVSKYLNSK
jgi:hypothetical protein